ncbi:hypothetical protein I3842_14G072600 [Carya illinoinensis]|uniref:Uncharacterized protein n=1 Tax=Carya illinoinensis TaxID=32201 RepID=A0A922D9N0_CARIL|nr:hypothetical protein I3842_14G072600 [Carya illinoinensis]KAG6678286.1 hypothetical protein I3842_14G072600 [Carya illinoinensis]
MVSSCFYKAPFTIKLPLVACTKTIIKMSRLTLIHVFLAWLLLAAASQYSYFSISVQAVESGSEKGSSRLAQGRTMEMPYLIGLKKRRFTRLHQDQTLWEITARRPEDKQMGALVLQTCIKPWVAAYFDN